MIRCGTIFLWRRAAAWLALSVLAGVAQAQPPAAGGPSAVAGGAQPPIPAKAFYAADDFGNTALSPSGRYLSVTTGGPDGRVRLAVIDLQNPADSRIVAAFNDADIDEAHWVDDEWLVFDTTDRLRGGGDQRWWPGLFSVRRDGTAPRRLVEPTGFVRQTGTFVNTRTLHYNHTLLHVPQDGSTEVIVGRHEFGLGGELDTIVPLRVDVATGRSRNLATGAPPHVTGWRFGVAGEPRVAISWRDGRRRVHWRAPGQAEWGLLDDSPYFKAPWTLEHLDGDQLIVSRPEGPASEDVLYRLDPAVGRLPPEPLLRTPGYDATSSRVAETHSSPLLGLRVTTDAELTVWFHEGMKKAQAAADARFPGRVNRLSCRRCTTDDPVVLVRSFSDTDPGRYSVFRPATGAWQSVGPVRAAIDPSRMAQLDHHRIRARDGLELPVWVTVPRGPKAPRPAVLLVHGGPWARGVHWHWDADAQFLASRGYAVIEPEFRGSTGYGQRLYRAGWKQWGRAMQDDLLDALDWAVAQKLVDPKRVCIMGASYGGYATLMALARDPDVFRCGISYVGLADVELMFRWSYPSDITDESRRHGYRTLIGDPEKDAELLRAVSPVRRAGDIRAPLLLAHGAQDPRVLPENATRMRAALQAAGREPEWVMYPDEGHGWYKLETRLDFAGRLERFLERHLKAPE